MEQFDSQIPNVGEIPRHCSESEQIGNFLERQREQSRFSLIVEQIRKHEFQADHERIQKLNDRVSKRRNFRVHQGNERLRRDQQLLHELLEQNRDLREAHEKSFNEMEELKSFQGFTFDALTRRKLVEDRDTILEFTGTHRMQLIV